MAVIMGVISPYWMKSIDPAVSGTLPRLSTSQNKPRTMRLELKVNVIPAVQKPAAIEKTAAATPDNEK
jgi:hypothetical protein